VVDWKRAIQEERAMLLRIVSLLFSLAHLAELARSRSISIRSLVLWILRPVESAVRGLGSHPIDISPAPITWSGDVRDDLMHLAARFRELARELEHQAKLTFSLPDEGRSQSEPFFSRAVRIIDAIATLGFMRPVRVDDSS
jgi:hypothetical protein